MSSRVSVCIPVYNGEPHIRATIDSVLAQTFDDFELIVVDNCSTDDTIEVVKSYNDSRISVRQNDTNIGAIPNWNKVREDISGEYWKLLCADDVIAPTCLERQVAALDDPANASATFTSCRRTVIDDQGNTVMSNRGLAGMSGLVKGSEAIRKTARSGTNPFGEPPAVLVRTEALEKVGPFRADASYMVDVDLWVRLLALGDVVAIPESLSSFRVHFASWSNEVGNKQAAIARDFVQRLRNEYPEFVSENDKRFGQLSATALGYGRQLAYFKLKLQTKLAKRR